jgi:hypothetical protein
MNLSVGFDRILTEARKYNLILAGLANQYIGQLSPPVRQAIFGNVGTLVTFRLGVEDANVGAREMGVFTSDEILNLEMGQAIARASTSSSAFNIRTYPPPPEASPNYVAEIVALTRRRYASPRAAVEAKLGDLPEREPTLSREWDAASEPSDPHEDDLVI